MAWPIDNGVIQDDVIVDAENYTVNTYIEGKRPRWSKPWVTWLVYCGQIVHETKITEHTLEAAEATHKYVVEHTEEILKEREKSNGVDF